MVEIKIDRDSEKRLYAQIRDALQEAIERREIEPGRQLPTVAAFARQIGVTQATIRRAYEDLAKSGLVGSHVGRGTFVLKNDASGPPRPAPDEEATQGPLRDEFMQAAPPHPGRCGQKSGRPHGLHPAPRPDPFYGRNSRSGPAQRWRSGRTDHRRF